MMKRSIVVSLVLTGLAGLLACGGNQSAGWPSWRGPHQNGVSDETGLVQGWSLDGENLVWRQDFISRSTPVVMNGRVFVNGRVGTGIDRQAVVAAFDAGTGEPLWEKRFNLYLTTVPYNRVGWASLTGDPETGYVYAQGVNGSFFCFDGDGEVVWQRSFGEEFGRFQGYGGRTASALIDEDRVIVNMINGTWGNQGPPRHRMYALDKRTGDVVWMSTTGTMVADRNTQSNAVLAFIGGQRLVIGGAADGRVFALQSRTGKLVWEFRLSKRGINVSPVVDGDVVFIAHSEENVDEGTLGRVVAIDATGSGDVTETHELWRSDHRVGFPSPMVHDSRLYVVDNSGNLAALDTASGEEYWSLSIGTVGKGSPVWADGRIYVTETNGHVSIIEPGDRSAELLSQVQVQVPSGRYAEIYGSPAIAYGRLYFTSEEGVYCIGDKNASFSAGASSSPVLSGEAGGPGEAATLLVVPAEVVAKPGGSIQFEARAFDALGKSIGVVDVDWELQGLDGGFEGGLLSFSAESGFQAGTVVAKLSGEAAAGLEAQARVRVFSPLPWSENFDDLEEGGKRSFWIGAGRYQVQADGESNVLVKPVADRGLLRSNLLIGPASLADYTIQADVKLTQKGRRRSDGGLINSGYILDLMGIHQRVQLRSWTALLRVKEEVDFEIAMDAWYTTKLQVTIENGEAFVRGKVWSRDTDEPSDWTLTAVDPFPVERGAPGLQAYSPSDFYFDNVLVTGN